MFRDNKREIFSFRKYKNGRTDSKLIGATLLALGVGLVTTTQSVSADVVNGAGGSEVTLVDSVDKTTSTNTNTFTDNTDTTKTAKFDAVLNKGVAEPTKANENKDEADGTDTVNLTSETTVNYKLEEDKSLLKTEAVATGQGTITTPYDKKGLAADTDGKDYRESTVDKTGITVSEETGKQDTLELNGKVYERTRSEVEGADKAKYSKTQFNDIEASVSPEGMHNKLGEIDYTKTTGKVYLVEETSDGHYGKFVETDGVSSDEDAVSKWKAGLANAKDFTKENVTLQEGDSILVLDKDTYAVGNSKTVKTVKKFKSPNFALSPDTREEEDGEFFDSPTFTISGQMDHGVSITTLGPDGRFKTGDDVTETMVANSAVFGFDIADFAYDDNPYFQLSPRKEDSSLQTPTAAEALKNNKAYRYMFDLLKFAEQQANTPEEAKKVADVKAKVDAYFEELPAKLKALGADVVWVNSGVLANTYAFYSPKSTVEDVSGLEDLLSPNRNLGEIIGTLNFKNIEKQELRGDTTLQTTTIEKSYTVDENGSISLTKTTINHIEGQVTRDQILENLVDSGTTKEAATELLKNGNVKVNDDGSVTVTSVETAPEYKFFQGESDNNVEAIPEGGYYKAQPDSGIEFISATETSSHNETTYNKRELITPIRAYKVVADGNSTVTHYYREKKAPLNVNYYLENTTTSLAPSENQVDLPVKSDYRTQSKEIPSKTEVQDLPEKTVTTVTTYELVATPDNANGKIAEGGTTVNYYYRAVEKVNEVAKQAPVTVNYYKEGTTEKLADSVNQGQKDIGSKYTSEPASIKPKVETKEFDDKTVTITTTYELVKVPDDKDGVVPVGGKVVNYYYREVVKEDVVKKQAPVTVNYYKEGTTDKLADSIDQGQKDIGSNYTTEAKSIPDKVEVQDLEDRVITKTTSYELVAEPTDKNGTVPVGGKVVNYFYRPVVKEDVVMKQAPVVANYYLEGTETKLAPSDDQGQKDIGSAYTTETKTIEPKVEVQDLEDRTITKTTTYELVAEPTDKNGTVPVGGKVVNYFYRPVVKEDVVMKQAPVTANYYLEGTETKLAPSDEQGQKDIGSNYTTEAKSIPDKVEVQDLEDRVITKTTSYELVSEPTDKEGKVPVGGKVVNYYYREVVKEDVVMKQAPVTVNYYKEGTTEKLADTIDQGQKDIGSNYTTEAKSIPDKVETKEFDDKTVTTTTSYELVKVPEDKDGIVPVNGKVVNYYYREVVKEDVVKKQAPVTANYYLEGAETKLAPSDEQGQKDIGSNYTTEAKVIPSKVEKVVENGNVITRTTSYELVKVPEDKDGIVPVGGKVVNYYYREVVEEVAKPNEAPKVEIPELKIPEESKPEPKPEPTPERTPTPQPAPAPQPEPSPAPNPVPVTPEIPERPIAPVTPEQPAEPATPQYMDGQRELPNTGTEDNASLAALGLLGVLSGFGLVARKKRKDEE